MKDILSRLKEIERTQPSRVAVFYPDGQRVEVNALKAFNMAVNSTENISFQAIDNKAMTTLLNAVRESTSKAVDE